MVEGFQATQEGEIKVIWSGTATAFVLAHVPSNSGDPKLFALPRPLWSYQDIWPFAHTAWWRPWDPPPQVLISRIWVLGFFFFSSRGVRSIVPVNPFTSLLPGWLPKALGQWAVIHVPLIESGAGGLESGAGAEPASRPAETPALEQHSGTPCRGALLSAFMGYPRDGRPDAIGQVVNSAETPLWGTLQTPYLLPPAEGRGLTPGSPWCTACWGRSYREGGPLVSWMWRT